MASGSQLHRIMVVDDNSTFRSLIRRFIGEGTFLECSNGAEALANYASFQPDWVLMDIEMAGAQDGLKATARLKQSFAAARVVIVTNHNHPDLRAAAHAVGAIGFFPKEDLCSLAELLQQPRT